MPGTDSANPLDWYAKAKRQFDAALLLREELPDLCLTHVQQTADDTSREAGISRC